MYENKILVNVYILSLSKNCEIFIPINEKIGNITKLLSNIVTDSIDFTKNVVIMNADTGECYKNNTLVRETNIKNSTKLVLI